MHKSKYIAIVTHLPLNPSHLKNNAALLCFTTDGPRVRFPLNAIKITLQRDNVQRLKIICNIDYFTVLLVWNECCLAFGPPTMKMLQYFQKCNVFIILLLTLYFKV